MQMYIKKGKKIVKKRFRKRHFVDEAKYNKLISNRPRIKELRGLKEVWKKQEEEKKGKK